MLLGHSVYTLKPLVTAAPRLKLIRLSYRLENKNTYSMYLNALPVLHHVVKDTVDSAPFHRGTGCYGRDGQHCEYDNQVANDDHQNSLPVARLKKSEKKRESGHD